MRRRRRHSPTSPAAQPRVIAADLYKWRQPIENVLAKRKEFKRIAWRACKSDASFAAMIYAAAAVVTSR
jgi:hypothetical protein